MQIDPYLLTCKTRPQEPDTATLTDPDKWAPAVAHYLNDLSDAYDDCNSKLGKVKGLVQN